MKFFQADDGCRIAFDSWGSGPSLLLLHGWSLDHRMWLPVVPILSQRFQLIAMDRRGFGQSRGVADKGKDLQDIDSLLQQLGLEKVHLLGMSQGGRVAINYCLTRPSAVETLILQGSQLDGYAAEGNVPEGDAVEQIPLSHYQDLVKAGAIQQFKNEWLQHPLMQIAEAPELRQQLFDILSDYQAQDLLLELDALQQVEINAAERLSEIHCPTLVLDSDAESIAIRKIADNLAAHIPHAQRVTLKGGGHLISMTKPQAFCRTLEKFLLQFEN